MVMESWQRPGRIRRRKLEKAVWPFRLLRVCVLGRDSGICDVFNKVLDGSAQNSRASHSVSDVDKGWLSVRPTISHPADTLGDQGPASGSWTHRRPGCSLIAVGPVPIGVPAEGDISSRVAVVQF